jgi:hypothetical protein
MQMASFFALLEQLYRSTQPSSLTEVPMPCTVPVVGAIFDFESMQNDRLRLLFEKTSLIRIDTTGAPGGCIFVCVKFRNVHPGIWEENFFIDPAGVITHISSGGDTDYFNNR